MPTSMQSAPARCEFRGGIEAYCLTASSVLSKDGRFVVCENWLNNDRVYQGAKEAGLSIVDVWPVVGGGSKKKKKKSNLFAVYVMKKKKKLEDEAAECNNNGNGGGGYNNDVVLEEGNNANVVRPSLIVRDENGKWTKEYSKVMQAMSIPVFD